MQNNPKLTNAPKKQKKKRKEKRSKKEKIKRKKNVVGWLNNNNYPTNHPTNLFGC